MHVLLNVEPISETVVVKHFLGSTISLCYSSTCSTVVCLGMSSVLNHFDLERQSNTVLKALGCMNFLCRYVPILP